MSQKTEVVCDWEGCTQHTFHYGYKGLDGWVKGYLVGVVETKDGIQDKRFDLCPEHVRMFLR